MKLFFVLSMMIALTSNAVAAQVATKAGSAHCGKDGPDQEIPVFTAQSQAASTVTKAAR